VLADFLVFMKINLYEWEIRTTLKTYTSHVAMTELLDVLSTVKFGRLPRQIRGLRASLRNRKVYLGQDLPVCLDVLVVGPGGSGSTELMEHISKYYVCNSPTDSDGLKHLPSPPSLKLANKILFVYRDFKDIKRSLSRRGIYLFQLVKLWPQGVSLKLGDRISLEFLIRRQVISFESDPGVATLFVHYKDLFESGQQISEFLGNKEGFVETFPRRRTLTSVDT
jgi:hypothetical protein